MEKIKHYWQLGVIIILVITCSLFGYFWGKGSAEIKNLKQEKQEYLQVKHEQDSIIKLASEEIIKISQERDSVIIAGKKENDNSNNIRYIVIKDKQKMHEEVNSIPNLSVDSIKSRFDSEADKYKP